MARPRKRKPADKGKLYGTLLGYLYEASEQLDTEDSARREIRGLLQTTKNIAWTALAELATSQKTEALPIVRSLTSVLDALSRNATAEVTP